VIPAWGTTDVLLDAVPEALIVVAADGAALFANPRAESMFGHHRAGLVGAHVDTFLPGLPRPAPLENATLLSTEAARVRVVGRRRDRTHFDAEITLAGLDVDGASMTIAVIRDVTERMRSAQRLNDKNADLQAVSEANDLRLQEHLGILNLRLSDQVAELEAKESVARDLHDVVIQRLFAVGLSLEGFRGHLPPVYVPQLEDVVTEIGEAIDDIRHTIFALEADLGAGLTLRAQLLQVVDQYTATLGFRPRLRIIGPVDTAVPAATVPHVLATVRESLSNVARHADASAVHIELSAANGEIMLRVDDDGLGSPPTYAESGLANLRLRAESLGGTSSTDNRTPSGFSLVWKVPTRLPPTLPSLHTAQ
jgi:PAS domain S-box-containing protein